MVKLFLFILFFIIFDFNVIYCTPFETFMEKDFINGITYFYCDSNDKKIRNLLIDNELNFFVRNFDLVTFNLVNFLKNDNKLFFYNHPNNHFNLILTVSNYLSQYYISFPFSHNCFVSTSQYYEFLHSKDWNNIKKIQYWRPYFSINNKQLVNVNKFNINPNNYMLNTDLKFKIYNILKLYTKH